MPTAIELVSFDPNATGILELRAGDEIIGVDNKVYSANRLPYVIVKRANPGQPQGVVTIWTITGHKLSDIDAEKTIQLSQQGKLFTFQRVSDGGARTGNYSSYLAWLIAFDCSGARQPVTIAVRQNGESALNLQHYLGTIGNTDKLLNVFAERQS